MGKANSESIREYNKKYAYATLLAGHDRYF